MIYYNNERMVVDVDPTIQEKVKNLLDGSDLDAVIVTASNEEENQKNFFGISYTKDKFCSFIEISYLDSEPKASFVSYDNKKTKQVISFENAPIDMLISDYIDSSNEEVLFVILREES